MTTAWELRNEVREMVEVDPVEHERLNRPFRKRTLNTAYYALTGRKIPGENSIGHIRYHLLKEVPGCERSALESDTPLTKDETAALLDALKEAACHA